MNTKKSKIAVTLFNFRDYCKTESDLDKTLDKLCEIGYTNVQVSGVALDNKIIKKQLDKHNLFCCATHENLETIMDTERLIERMQILGCDFAALGSPSEEYYKTSEMWNKLIQIFNEKSLIYSENNIKLAYHNHHFELQKMKNSKLTYLEYFYQQTSKNVYAEFDVHWLTRGGCNPAAWLNKYPNRLDVIHFKDFSLDEKSNPEFCEIGEGNLDWASIISACEANNVNYYSIEQDTLHLNRDIFLSAKISYDNLSKMLS